MSLGESVSILHKSVATLAHSGSLTPTRRRLASAITSVRDH
jgi:hypothetical protein